MRWLDCRSQNSLIHKGQQSSACSGCREHRGVGWALFSCGECGWDCVYQVGYTILTGTLQICLVLLCEGEEIIFLVKMMTVIWAICVQSCPRVCDDAVSVYFFFFFFFFFFNEVNTEWTNSSSICVWYLCMYAAHWQTCVLIPVLCKNLHTLSLSVVYWESSNFVTVYWAICVQSCPRVCDGVVTVVSVCAQFLFFNFFLTRSILNGPILRQIVFDICACFRLIL